MAAGFTVTKDNIIAFDKFINISYDKMFKNYD